EAKTPTLTPTASPPATASQVAAPSPAAPSPAAAANAQALGLPAPSLAPLVKRLSPAVVSIDVEQSPESLGTGIFGRSVPPGHPALQGQGSGFVISADGAILTNHHVVKDAARVSVSFVGGESYPARVIGWDERTDVALLDIEGDDHPYLEFADSDALEVGDWVVAIGNPYGLGHTVTAGIVSGKGRSLGAGPYDDFLQTDAAINPGNSGGPLFDLEGRVVGVNTAILNAANGIGFAIPSNMVSDMLDQLKTEGRVARGWMGVGLGDAEEGKGAIVAQVFADTPAGQAGLRAGDRVTQLNGEEVVDSRSLVRAVGQLPPGEVVRLGVERDGATHELSVTLAERPPEPSLGAPNRR
ncbi:trypsin-like peptidase domain-containing protein, partial [Myxococcota bacterium]|nr:trypsin-like peptidase domain-containing protein [Myxococcota bacterium]